MMASPILYLDIPSELLERSFSSPTSLNARINGSIGSVFIQKTKSSVRFVLQGPDLLQSSTDGWMCSSTINNDSHNPEVPLIIQYFQNSVLEPFSLDSSDISSPELQYSEPIINISPDHLSSTQENKTTNISESKTIVHLEECFNLDEIDSCHMGEIPASAAGIDCSVCPVCAGVFDKKALVQHFHDNHANVSIGEALPQSNAVTHGDKPSDEKCIQDQRQDECSKISAAMKCALCNFVAENFEAFDDHFKKHEETKKELCRMEGVPERKDQGSDVTHGEGLDILQLANDISFPAGKDERAAKKFTCKFCKEKFPKSWTRDRHQNKCEKNPNIVRILRCSFCGYATKNPASYQQHMEKHSGKGYECIMCGIKYTNSSGLYRHRRKVHGLSAHRSENQVYKCHECGKEIIDKHAYQVHIKRHTGIHDQICEQCGKAFKTSTDLQKHIRAVHLNRYHHHCKNCGHGVAKLSYLLSHQCKRVRRKQIPKTETSEGNCVNSFPSIDSFLSMDPASCLLMSTSESSPLSIV